MGFRGDLINWGADVYGDTWEFTNGVIAKATRDKPIKPKGQGIYDISSTQKYPLGTKLDLGDRVFRYALMGSGAAGVAGNLYESAAKGSMGTTTAEGLTAGTDASADGTTAYATLPNGGSDAIVVNQFKDGYLVVATGTAASDGRGQTFKIKSHAAAAKNTKVTLTLYDPIPVEIDTSEVTVSLIANPYYKVIISPAGAMTGVSVGVPLAAVTASYYCWLQTRGPCGVLLDSDVTAGAPLVADASTAGAITTQVVNAGYLLAPTVAHAIADADTGEYGLVDLCID